MRAKRNALIGLLVSAGLLYVASGFLFANGGYLVKISAFINGFALTALIFFVVSLAVYLVLSRRPG